MPRRHFAKRGNFEHQPQPGVQCTGITLQRRQFGVAGFLLETAHGGLAHPHTLSNLNLAQLAVLAQRNQRIDQPACLLGVFESAFEAGISRNRLGNIAGEVVTQRKSMLMVVLS